MTASSNGVGYSDVTNLAAALSGSGTSMHAAAINIVREATMDTEAYAKQYAPRRTGHLASTIAGHADGLTGVVEATAPYAIFVELGTGTRGEFPTGPIIIKPKNGKYLSWIDGNGKRVFAKSVTSPGMKSRPYLRPGLEQAISELEEMLGAAAVTTIVSNKTPGSL